MPSRSQSIKLWGVIPMNMKPLTAVDETQLLRKYKNFILRAVFEFCVKTSIDNSHPIYEDLILEAQIAFLEECRKQKVDSLDLTAWQHACVKNRMKSCMRVCFWRASNMGGYNTKKIDPERSYVFSDFESESNTEFENRAPSYYNIDDTKIDLDAFIATLPSNLQSVINYLILGYNDALIANRMGTSGATIGKWRKDAGGRLAAYLATYA